MQVGSLDWEDPPEEGVATHSSTLIWRIPWTEEPGGLQSMGSQRVRLKGLSMHSWDKSVKLWGFGKVLVTCLEICP